MTKTKLVDLNEIYNFVIDDLFIEKSFMVSKSYSKFSQFRFQNFQTNSDGKTTRTKDVLLDKI
jgi:hypothetical protein